MIFFCRLCWSQQDSSASMTGLMNRRMAVLAEWSPQIRPPCLYSFVAPGLPVSAAVRSCFPAPCTACWPAGFLLDQYPMLIRHLVHARSHPNIVSTYSFDIKSISPVAGESTQGDASGLQIVNDAREGTQGPAMQVGMVQSWYACVLALAQHTLLSCAARQGTAGRASFAVPDWIDGLVDGQVPVCACVVSPV